MVPRSHAFPSYPPAAELAAPRRVPSAAPAVPTLDPAHAINRREPPPERWCTPCALDRDVRTPATLIASEASTVVSSIPSTARPLQWWTCTPCGERDKASGKVARLTPIDEWFDMARVKWAAQETVDRLKGRDPL